MELKGQLGRKQDSFTNAFWSTPFSGRRLVEFCLGRTIRRGAVRELAGSATAVLVSHHSSVKSKGLRASRSALGKKQGRRDTERGGGEGGVVG